jgi:hypothetical protein
MVMTSTPRWATLVSVGLVLFAFAVFIWGRGGTAVLAGVALLFGALAVMLLCQPDGDPRDA